MSSTVLCGVDIGGTKLSVGLIASDGTDDVRIARG